MSVTEPSKILTLWAASGLKNKIPQNANNITGKAGFDQGFPAINMIAKEAGGIPPYGQDFNGILNDITAMIQFGQQGGVYTYDPAFATAIGGYTKGAILCGKTTTSLYQNQVDGNVSDPEGASSSGWYRFGPSSYGLPMIGELIAWPLASMPNEIWSDIGAKFIPCIGQPFSKTLYPMLAQLYPSGILTADMRGEFVRGWDNGRGVDPGRVIMTPQGSQTQAIPMAEGESAPTEKNYMSSYQGPLGSRRYPIGRDLRGNETSNAFGTNGTETRGRNWAWNFITRAA